MASRDTSIGKWKNGVKVQYWPSGLYVLGWRCTLLKLLSISNPLLIGKQYESYNVIVDHIVFMSGYISLSWFYWFHICD